MQRLSRSVLPQLPPSVRQPHYDRENLEIGMAHIGVGAFHRCHQAEFIDDMLEARFGRWGVLGVNLTTPSLAELLTPQDCLYSRTLRQDAHAETRIVGELEIVVAHHVRVQIGRFENSDLGARAVRGCVRRGIHHAAGANEHDRQRRQSCFPHS